MEKTGKLSKVVYHALKQGESSTVCYKEFQNGSWGRDDANFDCACGYDAEGTAIDGFVSTSRLVRKPKTKRFINSNTIVR
ncbi:MAG: hypothetical protein HFI40_09785 [Lachnospiraceae bacterium]|nr:hypothetical protein [Lachnospiraceae bacterium]MCX4315446.1 hypothetical protein [Lachnospiraceae bacterium]